MDAIVRFDKGVTRKIQQLPSWVRPYMFAVTFFGNGLPVFIILGTIFLAAQANTKMAILFIAITIIINTGLKQFIHRPRPDTLYVSLMRFKTHSFPSGHAFGSMTAYGYVCYLTLVNCPMPWSIIAAAILGALILLIGMSRIYLGAHYPTDVIGGWLLGLVCLSLSIKIT
jgi:undecaprenyl-diphosphatase